MKKFECTICGKKYPDSDLCAQDVCRDCHESITFEDCVNHTTEDELKWEAEKKKFMQNGK